MLKKGVLPLGGSLFDNNVDEAPAKSIAFNPGSPNLQQRYQDQRQQGPTRQDYVDYGWLFGGKR